MQQDLFEAETLKQEGMERSSRSAENKLSGWNDLAYEKLIQFLCDHDAGTEFQAEDVREWARIPAPPSNRAWGSVMVKAKRAGLIVFLRYAPTRSASAHRNPSSVWRAKK